ncbi:MAG TPA: hypothetical protein VHB30_14300 [Solirubrobacteraceae bacterium]|nr:hypothetical protein [Solirubrobacteraceae bacterium]
MAGRPHGWLDWSSLAARGDDLALPLAGSVSPAWIARLAHEVSLLDGDGWRGARVEGEAVRIRSLDVDDAATLWRALEDAVARTNAAFAPAGWEVTALPVAAAPAAVRPQRRADVVSLALILLAALAVALQGAEWSFPVRPIVVGAFVAIAPGCAVLRLGRLAGGWTGLGLVVALSLTLDMIVAGSMLYAGVWSPLWSLAVLAGLTAVTSLAALVRPPLERLPTR